MNSPEIRLVCPRCTAVFPDLSALDHAMRVSVRGKGASEPSFAGVEVLKRRFSWDVREAKTIFTHLTREPGTCHRCQAPLGEVTEGKCPSCSSINLDW